ncbi:MAG: methylated-DNA--[protein]-cysteine S-methyltransferase [Simkaniaceae bacterium]|nr:methylated-DNA--[protein]-cysteine S-methyltransferase [Simkaniaceae bacterium]
MMSLATFDTPLGSMVAVGDDHFLYLLEFEDRPELAKELELLQKKTNKNLHPGMTPLLELIQKEISLYFSGELTVFETPINFMGTPFQQQVWTGLQSIPFGETRSYAELAHFIHNPSACRAVGHANGNNQLAIIVPCHRVINANGKLGGYAGGISRKEWLLSHEKQSLQDIP